MSRCRLGLLPEGPTSSRGRTRVGPLFAAYSASIPWPRTRIQCIHRDCMSRRHRPPVHFSRGQQICDPSTSHLPLRPSKWLRGQEYDVPYSLVPLPPHVPDSHALPYSERVRVRSVPLFPSGRPRARLPRPDRDSRIGGSAEWGKSQTVGWGKASSILNNVLVLIADLLSVGLLPAETRRRESQMSGPRTAQRHARQRNVTAWARVHGSCRRRREYFETATISLSRFDSASRAHGRSRWAESVGGVGGRSR
jgi:hypothetical protein